MSNGGGTGLRSHCVFSLCWDSRYGVEFGGLSTAGKAKQRGWRDRGGCDACSHLSMDRDVVDRERGISVTALQGHVA